MSLWTKATLGVAAVVACAGGVSAQQVPGCATCGPRLAGAVPNTIPHCNKHDGLTQYPLSEKRYIKQFCHPTICPNSCFGHFKTQWSAWPAACPGWPTDGVAPANFGPNLAPQTSPTPGVQLVNPPLAPAETAPPPATPLPAPKAETNGTPPAPPSKPLDLPPSKPAAPKSPLEVPSPMPPVTVPPMPEVPGGPKLPALPPAGDPKF